MIKQIAKGLDKLPTWLKLNTQINLALFTAIFTFNMAVSGVMLFSTRHEISLDQKVKVIPVLTVYTAKFSMYLQVAIFTYSAWQSYQTIKNNTCKKLQPTLKSIRKLYPSRYRRYTETSWPILYNVTPNNIDIFTDLARYLFDLKQREDIVKVDSETGIHIIKYKLDEGLFSRPHMHSLYFKQELLENNQKAITVSFLDPEVRKSGNVKHEFAEFTLIFDSQGKPQQIIIHSIYTNFDKLQSLKGYFIR